MIRNPTTFLPPPPKFQANNKSFHLSHCTFFSVAMERIHFPRFTFPLLLHMTKKRTESPPPPMLSLTPR